MRNLLLTALTATLLSPAAIADTGAEPARRDHDDFQFEIRGLKGLFWDGMDKYYEALPWMAAHDMNWLMICYTAYPESAREWRKPYTDKQLAEMKELVTRAEDHGVTIALSYNPGIWSDPPLCHSCEDDYQAVWKKAKDAHSIGIYTVALCLDDIARSIPDADKEKYGTLEAAQVAFVNRLWDDMKVLSPQPTLIFCPSAYTTKDMRRHQDYTNYIGEHMHPDIGMFWTGDDVCSAEITVADAQEVEKMLRRKPFVWDNYPVNDMFPWRPLLAPVKGRDARLAPAVSGFLYNPMKQWEINRLPMISCAEYLADPVNYDASKAEAKILAEFPEKDHEGVRLLMELYGHSFLGEANYPPGPRYTNAEEAKAATQKLDRLEALLTAPGSEQLNLFWDDIKETVERERSDASIVAEAPIIPAVRFEGGAPDIARKALNEDLALIYAQPTQKHLVTLKLTAEDVQGAPKRVRLFARNGDNPRAAIRVKLNDAVLHDAPIPTVQGNFEAKEYDIPEGTLKPNGNTLTIENLDTEGTMGMPPWFAVRWVQLLP